MGTPSMLTRIPMDQFIYYTVEDFVCDQSFQDYCLEADDKAVDFWEQWIIANPSREEDVRFARQILCILSARQGGLRENLLQLKDGILRFDLLKQTVSGQEVAQNDEDIVLPGGRKPLRTYAIAAVIAASLAGLVWTGWYFSSSTKAPVAPAQVVSLRSTSITSGNTYRKTVVLPDGSVVTLHKNSTIILSGTFDKSDRDITLTGEAFFDVKHKTVPFIVHTSAMNVEVLGTAFNVSAYPEHPSEASLFRGKILVSLNSNAARQIILSPNEKLILPPANDEKITAKNKEYRIVPLSVDPVDHKPRETAWLRSRLMIEDESLETIAGKLEQWYGIQISFADSQVKAYRYSGTFENETVMKALEALQLSYPFNFRVEDNRIIISK